jgi:phosphatidylinositol glycan class B
LAAFFSIGAHQCDEIFQVYEFAGHKAGLNSASELPWEFHERMRSGIQPLIVFIITKGLDFISVQNPFSVALVIRISQSLFSFIVIVQFLKVMEREMHNQNRKLWLWAFSLLFWCLPYFHARFSSENFSTTLFILGLTLVLNMARKQLSNIYFVAAGILFGVSFICRFQMSFMIAGLFLWLLVVHKLQIKFLFALLLGVLFSLLLGVLADLWLYGEFTLSWWNYLDLNLFKDKASIYGREPLYFYLEESFLQLIPPFSILIIYCIPAFWIKFRKHVITWITLPFILLHFAVSHKELRFLFPIINFLPFMILYYFPVAEGQNNRLLVFLRTKRFIGFAVGANLLLLIYFTFKPADNTLQALKKIYDLVEGEKPILLYENRNPYNNFASLNYFRNINIKTQDLKVDSTNMTSDEVYYFSERPRVGETVKINNKSFVRIYSNFPAWLSYFNFSGWLERTGTYSIYKMNKGSL